MVHYVLCLLRSEAEMQCFVQFIWKFCCDTRCVKSCLAEVREVTLRNVSCNVCRNYVDRSGLSDYVTKYQLKDFHQIF